MFDGGGFMNDSIAEEPQQLTNSVSVGGDDRNKSLAAVSVAQICKLTRPNEGLIIHKKKIYNVNLLAVAREIIDKTPYKIHMMVDDFTSGGPLEVSHIIGDTGAPEDMSMFNEHLHNEQHENGDQRPLQSLRNGDWVRCIGVVKFTQDKPNLVAYNVRIVEDANEVLSHPLEVIHDSLYLERLLKSGGSLPPIEESRPIGRQTDSNTDTFANLPNRDKHVLKFLREKGASGAGVHFSDLAANLKAFTEKDLNDALNSLMAEGLCWEGDADGLWCVS